MNEPSPHHQPRYDDEISLYDLWDVLVRRLPVLLGVAVLVIAAGTLYAVTQPVEYTYTTGLEVAQMPDDEGALKAVVRRNTVQERLRDVVLPRVEQDTPEAAGLGVRVTRGDGDFGLVLETTTNPDNAADVTTLHQAIADALAESQELDIDRVLTARTRVPAQRVALLEEQLDAIQDEIADFTEVASNASADRAAIASQQIGELRREYRQLELQLVGERHTAEGLADAIQPAQTHYIARQSSSPAGAGTSLLIALSVVLAGMLGLFAAFFWEFVSNARARNA